MGTRKTRTTTLHPQSDGAVERLIRSLIVQLSLHIDTTQSDWDLQVPMVLMSLRGAPHSTTEVSPARMLFGRELSLPAALVRGVPPMAPPVPARLQYPAWLQERLRILHHEVRDRVNAVTLRRKERYDVLTSGPQFQPGDLVWLYDPRRRRKRNPKLRESGAKPAGGAKPSVIVCSAVKCRPQAAIVLISAWHVDTSHSSLAANFAPTATGHKGMFLVWFTKMFSLPF